MEHIFGKGKPAGRAPPSRGAVAGVKADMERAKQGFDPSGVGMAWTHNFLNQKPWHPMNFRNRMKVWEHETDKQENDKIKEKAQAEFDAEQEYLKTLSYLSPEEQRRYREVQSVSFMYQKPPGLDAALARDAEAEKKKSAQQEAAKALPAAAGAGPSGKDGAAAGAGPAAPAAAAAAAGGAGPGGAPPGPDPEQQRAVMVDRLREDPYAAMLAARAALQSNAKFVLRQAEVNPHGGYDAEARNQQLLVDDPLAGVSGEGLTAELEFVLTLPADQQHKALKRIAKRRKKEEEERKLREAEAVLRAAGYDLGEMAAASRKGGGGGGGSSKHKKHKHKSKSKSHKEKGEKGGQERSKSRDRGHDREGDGGAKERRDSERHHKRRRDSDSDTDSGSSSD